MRLFFLLISLFVFASASSKIDVYNDYKAKQYAKACKKGEALLERYKSDEKFISLYAFSCLKADKIDQLAVPIVLLSKSEEARANAAYFSVILMQKKLLLHALVDTYNFKDLKLPTTDYILSKVFDLYTQDTRTSKKAHYKYADPLDSRVTYKLFLTKDASKKKIIVEEYYDTIMRKRHIYR